jgi:hypothetical protein
VYTFGCRLIFSDVDKSDNLFYTGSSVEVCMCLFDGTRMQSLFSSDTGITQMFVPRYMYMFVLTSPGVDVNGRLVS